jgi:hypothetical protein
MKFALQKLYCGRKYWDIEAYSVWLWRLLLGPSVSFTSTLFPSWDPWHCS